MADCRGGDRARPRRLAQGSELLIDGGNCPVRIEAARWHGTEG